MQAVGFSVLRTLCPQGPVCVCVDGGGRVCLAGCTNSWHQHLPLLMLWGSFQGAWCRLYRGQDSFAQVKQDGRGRRSPLAAQTGPSLVKSMLNPTSCSSELNRLWPLPSEVHSPGNQPLPSPSTVHLVSSASHWTMNSRGRNLFV